MKLKLMSTKIMVIKHRTISDNVTQGCQNVFKGAVSRNSAKLGHYKMPVKLGET